MCFISFRKGVRTIALWELELLFNGINKRFFYAIKILSREKGESEQRKKTSFTLYIYLGSGRWRARVICINIFLKSCHYKKRERSAACFNLTSYYKFLIDHEMKINKSFKSIVIFFFFAFY